MSGDRRGTARLRRAAREGWAGPMISGAFKMAGPAVAAALAQSAAGLPSHCPDGHRDAHGAPEGTLRLQRIGKRCQDP